MTLAHRLRPEYPDAFDMTPGQLLFALRVVTEEQKREVDGIAVGFRVGGATKEGWQKYFKDR